MASERFFMRYRWSISDSPGFIVPTWTWSPGHHVHLEEVELYDDDRNFLGIWARYNMPVAVVRHIEKRIQERAVPPRRVRRQLDFGDISDS